MSSWEIISLTAHGDSRGSLVSIEKDNGVQFQINRVYYIFGTDGDARRGFHAHRNLDQLLIAAKGSCKVLVKDGKGREEIYILNAPTQGLRIHGLVWREMFEFSQDCLLLVLASEVYDEADYIRRYADFLTAVKR